MAVRRRYDTMRLFGVAGDHHRSYHLYMDLVAEAALHATIVLFRGMHEASARSLGALFLLRAEEPNRAGRDPSTNTSL